MDQKQRQRLYQLLGENIRKYRIERGLTQEQLANSISLKRTSIVNMERGRQNPPLHLLFDIADALKVTLDSLLPEVADFRSNTMLDDQAIKDVSEKDVQKLASFLEDFMKTTRGHE